MTATAVREILRTMRGLGFAGSVGTYQAVVELSSAVETFMPTTDSAPAHGVAGVVSAVPSARLVTYLPAGTPREEIGRLAGHAGRAVRDAERSCRRLPAGNGHRPLLVGPLAE